MTPRITHVYTEADRAHGIELYQEYGPAEAARRLGDELGHRVSRQVVYQWARKAGVSTSIEDPMQRAHQAAETKKATLRAELAVELHMAALDFVRQARGVASPSDKRFCMVAAGIAIDKLRLEAGEPTSREEHRHDYSRYSDADLIAEAETILRDAATG